MRPAWATALALVLAASAACAPATLGLPPPRTGLDALDPEALRHEAWALRRAGAAGPDALRAELEARGRVRGLDPWPAPAGLSCLGRQGDGPALVVWISAADDTLELQALSGAAALQLALALDRPEGGPFAACLDLGPRPAAEAHAQIDALGGGPRLRMGAPTAPAPAQGWAGGPPGALRIDPPMGAAPAADAPPAWAPPLAALQGALRATEGLRGHSPPPPSPRQQPKAR